MRRFERLSLWESWREAPERARPLTERRKHSDSIVLAKESAHRCAAALTCRACPLRHACGVPPLPKGEALAGRATSYWTPEVRYGAKGRALLQRAAASGQRTLSSCRCPGQRSTTAHETNKLCSFSGNLADMPKALPLGELAGASPTERARAQTERFRLRQRRNQTEK